MGALNLSVHFFVAASFLLFQTTHLLPVHLHHLLIKCSWDDEGHLVTMESSQYIEGNQQNGKKVENKTDLGNLVILF